VLAFLSPSDINLILTASGLAMIINRLLLLLVVAVDASDEKLKQLLPKFDV